LSNNTPDIQPDINKVAAELIIHTVERSAEAISRPLRDAFRRLMQGLLDAYRPYLESTYRRVSTIRTFIKPNEPIDLLSNYVTVPLRNGHADINPSDLIRSIESHHRYIISGLAGRGKSVLMRYIAILLYHNPTTRIPIFIELRTLNSLTSPDILQYVHAQYRGNTNVQFDDFTKALEKGQFIFILDGFDEISPQKRREIERQIFYISDRYDRCPIIVSGRPDDRFSSWERFTTLNVCPLEYEQCYELIEKCEYDDALKKNFLKNLTKDFFKEHKSFLNTPLLSIMMMITYNDQGEIPSSLHEFYAVAFETLIRRHDAMKLDFIRENVSDCNKDQFSRIFSSFCVLTYSKSQYQFSQDEILELLKRAISQQRIEVNPEFVLADFIESICLLQKEGFEISFVHRSFQEYFCALFLSKSPSGVIKKYFDSGKFRVKDNVVPMLYSMVPERVEAEWASGVVDFFRGEFPSANAEAIKELMKVYYGELAFVMPTPSKVHVIFGSGSMQREIDIVVRMYPDKFSKIEKWRAGQNISQSAWRKREKIILERMCQLDIEGNAYFRGLVKKRQNWASINSENLPIYRIPVEDLDELFIEIFDLTEICRLLIAGFRSVAAEQEERERGDDEFLQGIYES
jgi:hypothetical protein